MTSIQKTNSKFIDLIRAKYPILQKVAYFGFVFLAIFMFVMLMIPVSSEQSKVSFVNQTAFYSVKYASNFSKYYISLAPAGIAMILLWIIMIAFSLAVFIINSNSIKAKFIELDKKGQEFYLIKNLIINVSLGLILFLLLLFILVPPNFNQVREYYRINEIRQSAYYDNKQSIIDALNTLGVQSINGAALDTLSEGVLLNYLTTKLVYPSSFAFTWFTTFSSGVSVFSNLLYIPIIFFSILLASSLFSKFGFYMATKNLKIYSLFDKERIQLVKEKLANKKKERQEIHKTKKELSQKENELLRNLYEVNEDKIHEEKKLGIISQEELEAKLSKNNEIKKQLDELIQEKAKIQKQKISNSKIKSVLYKSQTENKPKKDKQKITIPDKELEEIFKNLEID